MAKDLAEDIRQRAASVLGGQAIAGCTSLPLEAVQLELAAWLGDRIETWSPILRAALDELGIDTGRKEVIDLAAAWFVLFAMSRPLDDFLDGDRLSPAWAALDRSTGLSVALGLIFEALALPLVDVRDTRIAQAAGVLAAGVRDAAMSQASESGVSSLEEYEQAIAGKGGGLVKTLFRCLVVAAGAGEPVSQALEVYGHQVGWAIQVLNDYHGVWCPERLGKLPGGDLRQSKLTYPLLYGLQVAGGYADELRVLLAVAPDERDVERLRFVLDAVGARHFMQLLLARCREYTRRALEPLQRGTQEQLMGWFDRRLLGVSGGELNSQLPT